MGSVSRSYSILRGRRPGDQQEAANFLDSLSPGSAQARNRSESKTNSRPKSYAKKYKMGTKY